jgi:hypothetical protein
MAVEQTEWFEPWLHWNHSQNEEQAKALALQTGSAFKEIGERVRRKCHFIPSGQGKEPIVVGDINLHWAA